jgi:SAM-dependent methyltransferase
MPNPYETDGGQAYHEAVNGGLDERGYALVAQRRAAKMQPFIQKNDAVLEYGVGTGWNLARLQAHSRKGFDVATAMQTQVEAQGIEFVSKLNAADQAKYDVVICSHVLEHLTHPADALTEILGLLKPNGKALIYVPYDVEKKFWQYRTDDPNHHLYGWNAQTLANLCVLQGFTIEKAGLQKFGYERFVAQLVCRWRLPDAFYTFLLKFALFLKPAHEVFVLVRK